MRSILPMRLAQLSGSVICLMFVLPIQAGPSGGSASEEEYLVYKAFLNSSYVEKADFSVYEKLGIFFIYNVKYDKPEEVIAFFQNRVGVPLARDLATDFISANRSPRRINPKRLPEKLRYSAQFIKKDVYSFSRVGFNARKDESLFYASFSSLTEDGHGALFYLQKQAGSWSVVKAAAVWMYGASVHPFNP